jgi:hypothetical protein
MHRIKGALLEECVFCGVPRGRAHVKAVEYVEKALDPILVKQPSI